MKSSYAESDERPMAVCELGGFVAVESENLFYKLLSFQLSVISFSPHVRECKTLDFTYWIPDANR